jgi:hypothetical protein
MFQKINKYSFQGARPSYGVTVCDSMNLGKIEGWLWDNRGINICEEQTLRLEISTITKDSMFFRTYCILLDNGPIIVCVQWTTWWW